MLGLLWLGHAQICSMTRWQLYAAAQLRSTAYEWSPPACERTNPLNMNANGKPAGQRCVALEPDICTVAGPHVVLMLGKFRDSFGPVGGVPWEELLGLFWASSWGLFLGPLWGALFRGSWKCEDVFNKSPV